MKRLISVDCRWFDVWAAVASINMLCVKNHRAGIARLNDGLSVKIDRTYTPPSDVGNGEPAENAIKSVQTA